MTQNALYSCTSLSNKCAWAFIELLLITSKKWIKYKCSQTQEMANTTNYQGTLKHYTEMKKNETQRI